MGATDTVQALKNSQRLLALEARRGIAPADRSRLSSQIWKSLTSLPEFEAADIVGGFPPIEEAQGQFAVFRLDRP